MCRAKISVSLLLILIFLAGVVAPVPECFVTGLLCPRAKAYACPAPVAKAPSDSRGGPHAVASCCAKQQKPQATQVRQVRNRLVELRSWMKPYAPEREVVEAPACPAALLVSLFYQPAPPDLNPIAVETLNPGKVPEPIPILLGKQSFLI